MNHFSKLSIDANNFDEASSFLLIPSGLTFLLRTPQRAKLETSRLQASPVRSSGSGRIWHSASSRGSIPRSSANSGAPLNPSGFLSLAEMQSLPITLPWRPSEPVNVHWISDTGKKHRVRCDSKRPRCVYACINQTFVEQVSSTLPREICFIVFLMLKKKNIQNAIQ